MKSANATLLPPARHIARIAAFIEKIVISAFLVTLVVEFDRAGRALVFDLAIRSVLRGRSSPLLHRRDQEFAASYVNGA